MVRLTYIDINMDKVYLYMSTVSTTRWHSRLERQSGKREVMVRVPLWAVIVHFVIIALLARSQLEAANTNEINRDTRLAYTLF